MSRLQRLFVAVVLTSAAVALAPPTLAGQVLYGSIVGTVSDAQGAITPGVTLTAINTGTGLKVETQTDEGGAYAFRNLLPGTYDLAATLAGFKEHKQSAIPVVAGNPVRINVTLVIGALEEVIDVVSESTLLQTEKADLTSEISAKAVTNLPLNQFRNYQSLLNLVPGATPTQFQNAEIDTPARSLRTWVNGTQPNANTTRVDGAVSVNVWLPHHAMYVQSAESIETVQISTNNFDADTGMAAGAAQTVITKSGTNQLKGSAFLFWNKDAFNTNTYFNETATPKIPKPAVDTKTFGGTVGGPVRKNKLFYFASWERYDTERPTTYSYVVPTAKMRAGDFSEVAAAYSTFKLFNPFSGTAGAGREQWTDNKIPSQFLSPITQKILQFYPEVNRADDLNTNLLFDDYTQLRNEYQKRDNVDLKINWQINPSAVLWGKLGYMENKGSGNNFVLGFDDPSIGNTRVVLTTFGTTWTLGPTTVIEGNFGMSRQDQDVLPPDYGTNYGIELGIPGVNNPTNIRESGLPTFASSYTIGTSPSWMPLWRKEISYSGTFALTKIFSKHEIRAGMDFVRTELNHDQAEWGSYGLKGGFSFANNTTGAVGYTSPGWNSFAAFLMGVPNFYSEDTQVETMTGRENQFAWYLRERWNVSQKLTVNLGARLDYYPLMNRVGRGIERLDYDTYQVILGGIGGQDKDAGIDYNPWYIEPRMGAAYRINEDNVFRAGYGQTKNPLPWSRPMRGSYPFDINNNASASGTYDWVTTLAAGIPAVNLPDTASGIVTLPRGVYIRSPHPGEVDRGTVHQWNVTYERRLPGRMAAEISYVGTATNGGYADLNQNVGRPGGGGSAAKYFAIAGTTAINDWAARTESRYKGLQVALNRPFRDGLLIKGSYTWSQAKNMADEDGWTGLTWNYLPKYDDNFAIAGFDRTHMFSLAWVYELPFLKQAKGATGTLLGGWQVNGVFAAFSGTPFSIGGSNNAMACQGCGSILINYNGEPEAIGSPDPGTWKATLYDKSLFSQPSGLDVAGFGNTKRNFFRRPAQTNLDLSFFKTFPFGRYRPEFRVEIANVMNTRNWGAPNTSITSPLFLTWSRSSVDTTATPGYRRMQLAFRFQF
jgi:hypothetical protein